MHGGRRKPNFDSEEWKRSINEKILCYAYNPLAKLGQAVGSYELFYNIKDGCIGCRFLSLSGSTICLFWEKKIMDGNKEKKLYYAAYPAEGHWQVRRVKEMFPSHIFIETVNNKIAGLSIYLLLITGKEEKFFMEINP